MLIFKCDCNLINMLVYMLVCKTCVLLKVVRGCYTQVHMLIVDGKMNCRIVHVNFRRLTAEAALLRPVHVVRIYFAAGGATTLLVPPACHQLATWFSAAPHVCLHTIYITPARIFKPMNQIQCDKCVYFFTDSLR